MRPRWPVVSVIWLLLQNFRCGSCSQVTGALDSLILALAYVILETIPTMLGNGVDTPPTKISWWHRASLVTRLPAVTPTGIT